MKQWDRFFSKYLVFPCQYHSTNAPHSFIPCQYHSTIVPHSFIPCQYHSTIVPHSFIPCQYCSTIVPHSFIPCHYHSTSAPHSFIHPSLALYNLRNFQHCYLMHLKKSHLCWQFNGLCICFLLKKMWFYSNSNNLRKFYWKGTKVTELYNHLEFQYYVIWMVAGYSFPR
jgi:hypothetical protein